MATQEAPVMDYRVAPPAVQMPGGSWNGSAIAPTGQRAELLPPPPSTSITTDYSDWLFDGPEGRGFAYYLAQGYRRYAKHEDNEHDFEDAAKFLQRAGAVERGERIAPEQLSMRILPLWSVDDLVYARQRMTRALDLGAADRLPKIAANAQVAFDCWMEQQEENIQPHDVSRCRKAFEGFIVRLESPPVRLPAPLPKAPAAPVRDCAPAPSPAPAAPACGTQRHTIFFNLDRDEITAEAASVIQRAAKDLQADSSSYIELTAHADRSGADAYNDQLSKRRLERVMAAFQNEGVGSERIVMARYYGEKRPAVATADGVREAANRRVEMRIMCGDKKVDRGSACAPAPAADACRQRGC
ncbi:MAG: OmpA family protein [Dechloromonas sp.]|nr:OmpA family protein [Dechloromonas sp.]